MANNAEFTVTDSVNYDRRSPVRWIFSHIWHYPLHLVGGLLCVIFDNVMFSLAPVLIGQAAALILQPSGTAQAQLLRVSLTIMIVLVLDGAANMPGFFAATHIGTKFAADARQELYGSLLGKSQTVFDRLRVGDLMARATDDVSQLSDMINPGAILIIESSLAIVVPFIFIAFISWQMLRVPALFLIVRIFTVRAYMKRLNPVTRLQRNLFGKLNAGLEETISGIEVVKASAQEVFERRKYGDNATRLRNAFVAQGEIEARYLPLLFYALAVGLSFLQSMLMYQRGLLTIPQIISLLGLVGILRFPTFISIFTFSIVQSGLPSPERILEIIRTETGVDENAAVHSQAIRGENTLEHVGFTYEGAGRPMLQDVSFQVRPGQTVAIVGQTGSGKTSLTQLVNRTYEASQGRVLIDGVRVRDWSLATLRSQIGKIEQDVFLFARSIAENICYGAPAATPTQVAHAAQDAPAPGVITP